MLKSIFNISKMDCASEEQLIRMKLEDMQRISSMSFQLSDRRVEIIHTGGYEEILERLNSLNLDTHYISSESIPEKFSSEDEALDAALLRKVLFINLFFFVAEIISGFHAKSMGLIADSLDMLADSIVYALSLYAVGKTLMHKKTIAAVSGYFQLSLAALGLVEVIRRFSGIEGIPSFETMIIVSFFALAGNTVSLYLLQKKRSKEVHMQASMIFTSNDVIANLGVIAAGILVLLTNSKYPDLVAGIIIFIVVGRGAFRILRLSK